MTSSGPCPVKLMSDRASCLDKKPALDFWICLLHLFCDNMKYFRNEVKVQQSHVLIFSLGDFILLFLLI